MPGSRTFECALRSKLRSEYQICDESSPQSHLRQLRQEQTQRIETVRREQHHGADLFGFRRVRRFNNRRRALSNRSPWPQTPWLACFQVCKKRREQSPHHLNANRQRLVASENCESHASVSEASNQTRETNRTCMQQTVCST